MDSPVESFVQPLRDGIEARAAIDRRALAAFRIGLGAILLVDITLRARFLAAFYTDAGVLPRSTLRELYPLVGRVSLHGLSGGVALQVVLFVLAGVAALALLVGYRSRLAAVLSFIFLLSLHARNPLVLNSGDSLLRQLLFWALFLPIGARWSLDAGRVSVRSDRVASVASAAILLQVVVVYAVNAAVKLRGGRWTEGTALQYVFSLDRYTVLLGTGLAELPWLLAVLERVWLAMLALSWLLLVLHGRARTAFATLFVAAHLGMALTLQLGVFPFVSIAGLLVFFHSGVWDECDARIVRPLGRRLPALGSPSRFRSHDLSAANRRRARRVATVAVALALVVMLGYNAVTLAVDGSVPAGDAGLDIGEPHWRMFAPNPPSTDGWYVVRGELASETVIDALHGGPATWDRPPDLAATYRSARWRKFLTALRWREDRSLYRSLAGHACRRWSDRGLSVVTIYFLAEPTNIDGPDPRERRHLGRFECGEFSLT